MRLKAPLFFLLSGLSTIFVGNAQTVSSILLDSVTQRPIPYATVQWANKKGAITNEEGRFSLLLQEKTQATDSLFISCLGYKSIAAPLNTFDKPAIYMAPSAIELKEVLVSNKQYTADEIIDLVEENLEKNYNFGLTKKRLFFRRSSHQNMIKRYFELKKSTIKEFNKKSMDSVINSLPRRTSYYTEILGDLYGNFDEEEQKLDLIKASELYDKNNMLSFENVEKKFNKILNENIKEGSYFKIKSGLFGTKVDADEIFEAEIDSSDVDALNEKLIKAKKEEEENKKNFAKYRRNLLSKLMGKLPIVEDSDLNFIVKSRKYEYTLQDFTYLGSDAVYVLDFRPKGSADYRGRLYVNSDDFALIRADFENVKSLKTFKLLGVSLNSYLHKGKVIFSKDSDNRYSLSYLESEEGNRVGFKRPLKIIELNKEVKGRNKQNEFSVKLDMQFSNVDKNEVVVFDTENLSESVFNGFAENNKVLPTYMPSYNAEFWKGYNIIEPNQAIREFTATEETSD